ncbi:MAG: sulfur carrier protein ThiS [Anaerolineae bacterium]
MIRVNNKWDIPWRPGMTIRDLLVTCSFTHHYVVVSVNGQLVPTDDYDSRLVADGDEVQVIHIIAGG